MSDATFEQWRALVEKGLKGAPFESLTATTLEGIPIAPLYAERDRPAAEGIPWAPRAERAMGPMRSAQHGIDLAAEQRGGASAVLLFTAGEPVRADVPDGMVALVDGRTKNAVESSSDRVRSLADPWRANRVPSETDSQEWPAREHAIPLIADALRRGACALGVDVGWWSEWRHGDAVDSLGLAIASLTESLRRLEALGLELDHVVERTTVQIDVDTDFFLEIAKLRALRRLLDRVLTAIGVAARPLIVAKTSERSRAQLDSSTNLIRFTMGAAGALVGGADVVCVLPYAWSQDAREIPYATARNTPLVLALESHLAAAADPSRGSPYLESMTATLASRAWEWFREIERAGGIARAYPMIFDRLAGSQQKRDRAVRTRKHPLVGVSRFPLVTSERKLGGLLGMAFPFEELRGAAVPAARCVVLGACPEPRVDYAREIAQLAAQRVDVVREVAGGDASFVILCAADADLATSVPEAARALRDAGVRAIAVAGKPGAHEQALRDAGVDSFVFVGADVVDALWALLKRAGGKGA